jgi:hypothetical protein
MSISTRLRRLNVRQTSAANLIPTPRSDRVRVGAVHRSGSQASSALTVLPLGTTARLPPGYCPALCEG